MSNTFSLIAINSYQKNPYDPSQKYISLNNVITIMIKSDIKYVLHIPLYRNVGGRLESIEHESILDELILNLGENKFNSFYTQKIKSYYNSKSFDEMIITIYTSKDGDIEDIFTKWCRNNHDILKQECYAYEKNDALYIFD